MQGSLQHHTFNSSIISYLSGSLYSIGKIGPEENKEYTKVIMAKLTEVLKIPADRFVQNIPVI